MATQKRYRYDKPEYLRLADAEKVFPMNQDTIRKIAVEIGALRKVKNMVLINYQMMKDFFESCVYVDENDR